MNYNITNASNYILQTFYSFFTLSLSHLLLKHTIMIFLTAKTIISPPYNAKKSYKNNSSYLSASPSPFCRSLSQQQRIIQNVRPTPSFQPTQLY